VSGGGEYRNGGVTTRVLAQNVHTFEDLPGKLQRLWLEVWGESVHNELFLVVAEERGDVFVFGEEGRAFGFQVVESVRWFAKIMYEIIDSPGDEAPDENGEARATFNLVENEPIADSREESWIDVVAEQLASLADRGPHKEE